MYSVPNRTPAGMYCTCVAPGQISVIVRETSTSISSQPRHPLPVPPLHKTIILTLYLITPFYTFCTLLRPLVVFKKPA